MRRRVSGALGAGMSAVLSLAAFAFACGSAELPSPDYTKHPTSALVEIPYPPPPARIEAVPEEPDGDVVWIDGEWLWQSRRWSWKPGRWIHPPAGARFSPWTTVRDRIGTLYVASGTWRNPAGAEVPEPAPLAIGGPAPAAIVTPEGEEVTQGPTAPLDAGTEKSKVDEVARNAVAELDASRNQAIAEALDGAATDAESKP